MRWIGYDITARPTYYREGKEFKVKTQGVPALKKLVNLEEYEQGHSVTKTNLDHYGLTCDGEPVCVEAFCV